jgi:hypothetical protein
MKTVKDKLKGKGAKSASKAPGQKDNENLEPCTKAFHQETARLKDADDACDDGVR